MKVAATGKLPETLIAALNSRQRQAVEHDDGPLLIVAGAGTGKTTTLAHRVAALLARGVPPQRILLLTFTRRSAVEMQRRVTGILSRLPGLAGSTLHGLVRQLWSGTFHAIGMRLLRQHGELLGLSPAFSLLDRGDAEDVMGAVRLELGLSEETLRFPTKSQCLDLYSRCGNSQRGLSSVLEVDFPQWATQLSRFQQLFRAYSERKEQQLLLDYDDLLLFWQILVTQPEASAVVRRLFDCVLVDEYQDTNPLQLEILRGLTPDGRGLTVVGDDAQAIYGFRFATVRNILDFPQHFPQAEVIALEQNYRSTQPLLDATNGVIALAAEGHRKQLWSDRSSGPLPQLVNCLDEGEQTEFVLEKILEHCESGLPLQRQAVLFRASHHSLSLELELARRGLNFQKFGGIKLIESAHVKDLLAFLRWAENPRDSVSMGRWLQLLPGVGPRKAQQLLELCWAANDWMTAWSDFVPPKAAALHWPLAMSLARVLTLPPSHARTLPEQVRHVRLFLEPLMQRKFDDAAVRMRDLEQLEVLAARFESRAQFLNDLTLDPPASLQASDEAGVKEDSGRLTLSTIHSAKGLEWDVVYVLHATDGSLPSEFVLGSEQDLEEERRLFYVALTRAREHLYVCSPQKQYVSSYARSDRHTLAPRTRFLPDALLPLFEVVAARHSTESPAEASLKPVMSSGEARSQIGKLWD